MDFDTFIVCFSGRSVTGLTKIRKMPKKLMNFWQKYPMHFFAKYGII